METGSQLCFEDSPDRFIAIFCFEDKASKSIANIFEDRPTNPQTSQGIEAPSRSLKIVSSVASKNRLLPFLPFKISELCHLISIRAALEASINILRKSRFKEAAETLVGLLEIH